MHVEQARLEFCRGSWDAAVGLAELSGRESAGGMAPLSRCSAG